MDILKMSKNGLPKIVWEMEFYAFFWSLTIIMIFAESYDGMKLCMLCKYLRSIYILYISIYEK